jgi:hypothetical protein
MMTRSKSRARIETNESLPQNQTDNSPIQNQDRNQPRNLRARPTIFSLLDWNHPTHEILMEQTTSEEYPWPRDDDQITGIYPTTEEMLDMLDTALMACPLCAHRFRVIIEL